MMRVAIDPDMLERTVSILVASSLPIDPALVSALTLTFHTASGTAVIIEPIEVEARSVCPLTTDAIDDDAVVSVPESVLTCELVFPLTTAAIELDAVESVPERVETCEFVLPLTTAAIELDAVVSVLESVVTCELVFPLTTAATDEVATANCELVLPLMLVTAVVIALVTPEIAPSTLVASRAPIDPAVVSELVSAPHTEVAAAVAMVEGE